MGEGRRVYQDEVDALTAGVLYPLHQFVLGIALHVQQVVTAVPGQSLQAEVDIGQGGAAVDIGLAPAEQVQVGAVQYEYGRHGAVGSTVSQIFGQVWIKFLAVSTLIAFSGFFIRI